MNTEIKPRSFFTINKEFERVLSILECELLKIFFINITKIVFGAGL